MVLVVVKIVGGVLGNIYVLIVDGVELLLDIFFLMLVWVGLCVVVWLLDENYFYGYGKVELFVGFVVVGFVFLVVGWIGWYVMKEIVMLYYGLYWGMLLLLVVIIVVKFIFFWCFV